MAVYAANLKFSNLTFSNKTLAKLWLLANQRSIFSARLSEVTFQRSFSKGYFLEEFELEILLDKLD